MKKHIYDLPYMSMNPLQLFKCLADETRLQILLLINQQEELCVCELVEAINESQPKISRHLAQLRGCGLLSDRRAGQWVHYSIHPQLPEWVREIIATTAVNNEAYLKQTLSRLNKVSS